VFRRRIADMLANPENVCLSGKTGSDPWAVKTTRMTRSCHRLRRSLDRRNLYITTAFGNSAAK
jgi:hypothetical protein